MMGACKAYARVPFTYSLSARNTATASRVSWAYTPENEQNVFQNDSHNVSKEVKITLVTAWIGFKKIFYSD